jgi:hypothetical protein
MTNLDLFDLDQNVDNFQSRRTNSISCRNEPDQQRDSLSRNLRFWGASLMAGVKQKLRARSLDAYMRLVQEQLI